jgi:hypothetical protein
VLSRAVRLAVVAGWACVFAITSWTSVSSAADGLDDGAIKRLVELLGDDQFQVREQATRDLLKVGPRALGPKTVPAISIAKCVTVASGFSALFGKWNWKVGSSGS